MAVELTGAVKEGQKSQLEIARSPPTRHGDSVLLDKCSLDPGQLANERGGEGRWEPPRVWSRESRGTYRLLTVSDVWVKRA